MANPRGSFLLRRQSLFATFVPQIETHPRRSLCPHDDELCRSGSDELRGLLDSFVLDGFVLDVVVEGLEASEVVSEESRE
jgi:hypothetical protein